MNRHGTDTWSVHTKPRRFARLGTALRITHSSLAREREGESQREEGGSVSLFFVDGWM
jgi:hypothetical protein